MFKDLWEALSFVGKTMPESHLAVAVRDTEDEEILYLYLQVGPDQPLRLFYEETRVASTLQSDNQTKLRNWELEGKEKYYYHKFGENCHGNAVQGTATVCVIPVKGVYARGVAFCNPVDQFNRKLGRAIALGRAVKAIENHAGGDLIKARTPAWILYKTLGWICFSAFEVTLTDYEKKLFK